MNFVETIRTAGVACAGDNNFPNYFDRQSGVDFCIVNAAGGEPLVETNSCLCRTFPDRVVAAAAAIAECMGAKRTVIALSEDDELAIEAIKGSIAMMHANIELLKIETFYSSGDELVIVYLVTGRCVPEGGIPLDVGCAVSNVATALDLLNGIQGIPVTDRYLTVTGKVKNPVLLKIPIGTHITECLDASGPLIEYSVIVGGPMMGRVITSLSAIEASVVTTTIGNLIVLPRNHYLFRRANIPIDHILRQATSACIQCHMCTDLCPRFLLGHSMQPDRVMRSLWREREITDDEEYLQTFGNVVNCSGCGVCEMFACPMGLSPRRVNGYVYGMLKKRGIIVPRNMKPKAREFADIHRISTERLAIRLGLSDYYGPHMFEYHELTPGEVLIPFRQKKNKPVLLTRHEGDIVERGELLAVDGFSVNIHASISGTVTKITESGAHIVAGKE